MLGLDLLDALELRGTQSTVFAFPLVVGWLAYPVLATQVTDFDAAIGFFENRDDLRLGESTFFHSGVWSDPRNLSTLFIHCRAIGEVDTTTLIFSPLAFNLFRQKTKLLRRGNYGSGHDYIFDSTRIYH